jgi:hypothetical protein
MERKLRGVTGLSTFLLVSSFEIRDSLFSLLLQTIFIRVIFIVFTSKLKFFKRISRKIREGVHSTRVIKMIEFQFLGEKKVRFLIGLQG